MTQHRKSGHCNCGIVSFEFTLPTRDIYACHCSICRRSTGNNGVAVVIVRKDAFAWTSGEDRIRRWRKPDADWGCAFCERCGSALPDDNDEKHLYVSDTGASDAEGGPPHIRIFDVGEDSGLSGGELFAKVSPGASDGFRLDTDGNVWTSAGGGVNCYSPEGVLLGRVQVPETVANVEFGGPRRNRLFICATTSLYAIYTGQNGARRP